MDLKGDYQMDPIKFAYGNRDEYEEDARLVLLITLLVILFI